MAEIRVTTEMTDRELISAVLKKYALRHGKFKLASGVTSNYYLDVKNALLHPLAGRCIAVLVARAIAEQIDSPGCTCVAGVPDAGTALAWGVSQVVWKHGLFWPALMIRKGAREHGTQKHIEGDDNLRSVPVYYPDTDSVEHRVNSCVLVEDVITSGGSALRALTTIDEHPLLLPRAVVAVVDREEGGVDKLKRASLSFRDHPLVPFDFTVIALTTMQEVIQSPQDIVDYLSDHQCSTIGRIDPALCKTWDPFYRDT